MLKALKAVVFTSVMAVVVSLAAVQARASVIVLTFEGLQDQERILDFYNGGTGSLGSGPGTNHGIGFGTGALALIDADQGGTGNFASEPSPDTIAFFLTGSGVVMNVAAGFTTGFSFFYSSNTAASIDVYGGLDGTGALLASVPLVAQGGVDEGCRLPGDPTGYFACWDPVGVAFGGTALSVNFGGSADHTGFDNITLGSETPGTVPEPASLLLFGAGSLALGYLKIKKAKS